MMIYFSILYFLNMSSRALFAPFVTVYMGEKGLSSQEIGIVMSMNSVMLIVAQPLWGTIADRFPSRRKVVACCFIFQAMVVCSFNLITSAALVAGTYLLSTFFSSPEGPLMDTWVLGSLKEVGDRNNMGRLKFWGCAGYAIFSSVGGMLVSRYSTTFTIPIFAAVLLMIGALILVWGRDGGANEGKKAAGGVLNLFRDKALLIFLIYMIVMQIPHRAAFTFYPILIEQLGGGTEMVGYTSSVMFISEALIMFISGMVLKKLRPVHIVMLSSAFFALWQFLYAGMTQPWHVVAAAVLDGPAYACLSLGVLYYADEIAPEGMRSTYQALIYACYFGVSGIIGNTIGGIAVETIGLRSMYLAGGTVIVCATAAFALINRLKPRAV